MSFDQLPTSETLPREALAPPHAPPHAPQHATSADAKGTIFGSFWVDEAEFALPVSVIREVVNVPSSITPVPLSPPFMKGLFNLRGMVIPIVDLRILLDYPPLEKNETEGKIAILENGDLCIGLLFDSTGEVLNEKGVSRIAFKAEDGGIKDVIIDGVLKLENGDRMVQILDPYELLRIQKVPKADNVLSQKGGFGGRGKRLNCISFQLGHTSCAIDLRFVEEVTEMPKVDQSLLAHGYIIGTANLRGKVIPVVDFRSFVGDEPPFKLGSQAIGKRKMLVMKTKGGLVGLMVFSIDSIVPYFESDVLPFAKLALPRSDIVTGCLVPEPEKLVMLLDHARLQQDEALCKAAATCQEVHPSEDEKETAQSKNRRGLERKTFILFSMEKRFALDTAMVSEVINRPDELLEPPYALSFVQGILNLRGELITLINSRLLYGLPPLEGDGQKVLIFKHGDQKYAILVDSVDEIVMTDSSHVAPLKPMDYKQTSRSITEDVSGCLRIPGAEGTATMILDVGALVQRCVKAQE